MSARKPLTPEQLAKRLPDRPWFVNVYEDSGDINYQVQASDGQVIGNFRDSDFDKACAARATAQFICDAANREPSQAQPVATTVCGACGRSPCSCKECLDCGVDGCDGRCAESRE